MAERPNQNWFQRFVDSYGPKFRIDINNPQMGENGAEVYSMYGVTENGEVSLVGLSEGGMYHIYNDHSIEIVAGQKSKSTGIDIQITGKNGDICITAEKSGKVKIRASQIILDADKDIILNAGKNVTINAGQKFSVKANEIWADGLLGNLTPKKTTFGQRVFKGTFVGSDVLDAVFSSTEPKGECEDTDENSGNSSDTKVQEKKETDTLNEKKTDTTTGTTTGTNTTGTTGTTTGTTSTTTGTTTTATTRPVNPTPPTSSRSVSSPDVRRTNEAIAAVGGTRSGGYIQVDNSKLTPSGKVNKYGNPLYESPGNIPGYTWNGRSYKDNSLE